jgi:hypothetical protein
VLLAGAAAAAAAAAVALLAGATAAAVAVLLAAATAAAAAAVMLAGATAATLFTVSRNAVRRCLWTADRMMNRVGWSRMASCCSVRRLSICFVPQIADRDGHKAPLRPPGWEAFETIAMA